MGQQRQNTGRRIGGPRTSERAGHRVRRTGLTRTDVGDELTVIWQLAKYRPTTVPGRLDTGRPGQRA